jgi:hypothetical protein
MDDVRADVPCLLHGRHKQVLAKACNKEESSKIKNANLSPVETSLTSKGFPSVKDLSTMWDDTAMQGSPPNKKRRQEEEGQSRARRCKAVGEAGRHTKGTSILSTMLLSGSDTPMSAVEHPVDHRSRTKQRVREALKQGERKAQIEIVLCFQRDSPWKLAFTTFLVEVSCFQVTTPELPCILVICKQTFRRFEILQTGSGCGLVPDQADN